MITMQSYNPAAQYSLPNMFADTMRAVLPSMHTQMNQMRLNMLQVRQARIKALDQCIEARMEADKKLFELVQAMHPIVFEQSLQMRKNLLEMHQASIAAMNQAMEQSLKTDQQLYDASLELLNKDKQQETAAEDLDAEAEVEVVPDEDIAEEEPAKN